jgi:hypothetical protein
MRTINAAALTGRFGAFVANQAGQRLFDMLVKNIRPIVFRLSLHRAPSEPDLTPKLIRGCWFMDHVDHSVSQATGISEQNVVCPAFGGLRPPTGTTTSTAAQEHCIDRIRSLVGGRQQFLIIVCSI